VSVRPERRRASAEVEGRMTRRSMQRASTSLRTTGLLALGILLAACRETPSEPSFPDAGRDVAPIVSDRFSTEEARDRIGEAEQVMALAGVKPGMSVADVGAGEGYYTVRLARAVGRSGRVLAEDIDPDAIDGLGDRVQRERLDNVAVKLGTPTNPMLPTRSFDRIFLVHMYHEVTEPYAFLWHLREGVKRDGEIVLVDSDRPVKNHGIPPKQADCEFRALGLTPVRSASLEGGDSYFRAYRIARERPRPEQIKACGEQAG
jgi:ubiquinone/menaquinone biosynthesis C-methylase UbiE